MTSARFDRRVAVSDFSGESDPILDDAMDTMKQRIRCCCSSSDGISVDAIQKNDLVWKCDPILYIKIYRR